MTQTFFIVSPNDATIAAATGFPCVLLCYRIRQGCVLQSANPPQITQGCVLGILSIEELDPAALPQLRQQILAECRRRRYIGICFCSEIPPLWLQPLESLCAALQAQGLMVFLLPEPASKISDSIAIFPGSLSGGSFVEMIAHYTTHFPANRIALLMQRCHHRFSLPSASPDGTPLPSSWQPSQHIFYSPALCTNYCLLPTLEDRLELILTDDTTSISRRIQAASNCSIPYVFLPFNEWQTEAEALLHVLLQTKE